MNCFRLTWWDVRLQGQVELCIICLCMSQREMIIYHLKYSNLREQIINSRGPKYECWETTCASLIVSEWQPPEMICCNWFKRYNSTHFRAVPVMPRLNVDDEVGLSGLTCQKPHWDLEEVKVACADGSYSLVCISFWTLRSGVSVLWHFLCADWNWGYRLRPIMWSFIWLNMVHSLSFDKNCRLLTGHSFLNVGSGLPSLGGVYKGFDSFHSAGK